MHTSSLAEALLDRCPKLVNKIPCHLLHIGHQGNAFLNERIWFSSYYMELRGICIFFCMNRKIYLPEIVLKQFPLGCQSNVLC